MKEFVAEWEYRTSQGGCYGWASSNRSFETLEEAIEFASTFDLNKTIYGIRIVTFPGRNKKKTVKSFKKQQPRISA